MRNKIQYKT